VFSSNNHQCNHHDYGDPSQEENKNWDVEKLIPQGDAIYDYERVPAAWSGFDEQPIVYQYGDTDTEVERVDRNWWSFKR